MWAIFLKGGIIMIPLAVLSVVGLAVTVEKLITLRQSRIIRREVVDCPQRRVDRRDFHQHHGVGLCTLSTGPQTAHQTELDPAACLRGVGGNPRLHVGAFPHTPGRVHGCTRSRRNGRS